jgi:hypothetical protein
MPIPERINLPDGAFYMRAKWTLCRVTWPQRCELSGRRLWPGTLAYRGRAIWYGPGTPVIEEKWHDQHEHIMWQLKE